MKEVKEVLKEEPQNVDGATQEEQKKTGEEKPLSVEEEEICPLCRIF